MAADEAKVDSGGEQDEGTAAAVAAAAPSPASTESPTDTPDAAGENAAPPEPKGDGGKPKKSASQKKSRIPEPQDMLVFRKWDVSDIEIVDPGLKTAISLRRQITPHTFGRSALKRFNKADANIVERLMNKTMHFGKKYAKNTGRMSGKKTKVLNTVKSAFDIINIKSGGKNPVEVLVRAVEFSAPNEDTTRIVYGGTVYHVSVDVAPIRRVDLALKFISDAIKEATFSNPKPIEEHMAEQLMMAAANDPAAPSVKKKNELERIAQASR